MLAEKRDSVRFSRCRISFGRMNAVDCSDVVFCFVLFNSTLPCFIIIGFVLCACAV